MQNEKQHNPINMERAVRDQAQLGQGNRFEIRIDADTHVVDDPIVTGDQLLHLAGKRPATEHLIYLFLRDGSLEGIRPEETVDLRTRGVERFLTFKSTTAWFFLLDDRKLEWGGEIITGRQLKLLAGVDPVKYDVWQETRGGDDRKIGDRDEADLTGPGLERFYTAINQTTEGLVAQAEALPASDRRYLENRGIGFEILEDRGQKGIVFPEYSLPGEVYDNELVRLLIVLPANYPNFAPDMFFADPWIRLKKGGAYPTRADVPFKFGGTNWQRWSRHNQEWRRGVDGIHTMLARVDRALLEAGRV